MKKILNFALVLLAGLSVVLSCSKQENDINNPGVEQGKENVQPASVPVTITATLSDALTKVDYTVTYDTDFKPTAVNRIWNENDLLRVKNAADESQSTDLAMKSGKGTKTAVFEGTLDFTASSYNVEVVNDDISDYTTQTQAEDGDTAHLQYVAAATGVTDLSSVTLTETSRVLGIIAKMPDGVAATITSLEMECIGDGVFGGVDKKKLTINISTPGDADNDNVLKIYVNVPAGWTIPAGKEFFLRFNSSNAAHTVYTRYYKASKADGFDAKKFTSIKLNCSQTDKHAGLATSDGSAADKAYLIADKYQFANLGDLMADGETKYFKVIDDIDMNGMAMGHLLNNGSGYAQLVDFDGNNKTISNLGGTMFYVFKGSIKNLTLNSPAVSTGSQKGAFAQYIQGTNNYITNVDINNVSTFEASNGNCGGLVGRINGGTDGQTTATIKDCDLVNVVVNSSDASAGGLIGSVEAKVIVDKCTCTGSIVNNTKNYAAGLIGKTSAEVSISNCSVEGEASAVQYTAGLVGYFTSGSISNTHVSVTVNSAGHYAGGLIAYMAEGAIEKTYATGNVTSSAKCYRVGGLVGYAIKGSISECYATGTLTGTSTQYFGGLVGTVIPGDAQTFTISNSCYTTGKVAPSGNYAGGLVGDKEGVGSLTISNCYVSGDVHSSGPQRFGGILAGHLKGTTTIENCYFAGTLQTNACLGGIVGWIESDGVSVTRCMSFPKKIFASQNVASADRYCSGIIIGYAHYNTPKLIVDQCYRPAGIDFLDYTGVATTNVVEDHDFITGTPAAIPQRHGLQYGYYHHGKETDSATLSALVQRTDIGGAWSATIWDFAQDYPRLKWMLE